MSVWPDTKFLFLNLLCWFIQHSRTDNPEGDLGVFKRYYVGECVCVGGVGVLVIPALKKLRQEASHDFTVSLGFIASNRSDMNK